MKISKYRGDDREALLVKIAYRFGAIGVSKFIKAIKRITDKEERGKTHLLGCEVEDYLSQGLRDEDFDENEEKILVLLAHKLGESGNKPDAWIEQEPDPATRAQIRGYLNKVLAYLDADHDRPEIEAYSEPTNVVCPYCGSRKVKIKKECVGSEVSFTGCCRNCKRELGSEEPPVKTDYFTGEEHEKFINEIGAFDHREDEQYWALFLFKKASQGKIAFDLSPKALARCEKNYRRHPKDRNVLFAQLMASVLTGKPWKELARDFFQPLPGSPRKRAWYLYGFLFETHKLNFECERISKRIFFTGLQKQRLKEFFLWFMNAYPALFKEITSEDLLDYEIYGKLAEIIGSANAVRYIDPMELVRFNLGSPFPCTEHVIMPAVFAEVALQDEKWGLALFIYQKILFCFEESYDVSDACAIYRAMYHSFHKDIFPRPLKYGDLKARVAHCLEKVSGDPSGASFRAYSSLEQKYYKATFREQARQREDSSENERELSEYRDAREITMDDAAAYPYLVIRSIERNMREMLFRMLSKLYRGKTAAWGKGVPYSVREKAVKLRELIDPMRKGSEWECLEFSDYSDIVRKTENWEGILKSIFILENEKANVPKEERGGFLSKLISFRNDVMHGRDLTPEAIAELKAIKDRFDRIYEKSKSAAKN